MMVRSVPENAAIRDDAIALFPIPAVDAATIGTGRVAAYNAVRYRGTCDLDAAAGLVGPVTVNDAVGKRHVSSRRINSRTGCGCVSYDCALRDCGLGAPCQDASTPSGGRVDGLG